MEQKTILVVSQIYPYPLHNGGCVDIFNRLKALKNLGHSVSLIAYVFSEPTEEEFSPLRELCKEIFVVPMRRKNILKMFSCKPYFIANRENFPFLSNVLPKLVKRSFDYIISESHNVLTASLFIKQKLNIPSLALRVHNNEPCFMKSLAKTSPFFSIPHLFFSLEAWKYYFFEKKMLKRLSQEDFLLHISYDECVDYRKRFPSLSHDFLPAAVDVKEAKPYTTVSAKYALFVGALFSPNNVQGLEWYLDNVHGRVLEKLPDYKLIVAGTTKGADRVKIDALVKGKESIMFYDTPESLDDIYKEASVFINPMREGAGVKLKTINAILAGLPVVSTKIGNEGTGLQHKKHTYECDTPEDFYEGLIEFFEDETLRRDIVNASQSYLSQHYDQEASLKRVLV
jgi:polysaccharide biosynthesis protein PslH